MIANWIDAYTDDVAGKHRINALNLFTGWVRGKG